MDTPFKPTHMTAVVGLGASGISTLRFLRARGVPCFGIDTRVQPPQLEQIRSEFADVELVLGRLDAEVLNKAQQIVLAPGLSVHTPAIAEAVARGVAVMGDIELFACYAQAPVAAITGSNGKSTVTTLLGDMLQRAGHHVLVGGNIGTPALELLDLPVPEFYVLELSSFQLETTWTLNARVATVLNISEDHMDRYSDVKSYADAKQRIFQGDGTLVLNRDDPAVMKMRPLGRHAINFGGDAPSHGNWGMAHASGRHYVMHGEHTVMAVDEIRLPGLHNAANVLAAMAMATELGIAQSVLVESAKRFSGLAHRCQWVAKADDVNWYDDSKGTNVGATLAALTGFQSPVVLIAGGDGKGADFSPLRSAVAQKARAVVLIGRDAPIIARALAETVPLVNADSMEQAVHIARQQAKSGDVVLLSPACASFDMFRDYKHRGEVFAQAVHAELKS